MNRQRASMVAAAAVAAAGLSVGAVGLASADDTGAGTPSSSADRPGPGHGHGPGFIGRGDGGAELAKALGVSEEKLRTALKAVREDLAPKGERPDGPPSEADRTKRQKALAAALAKELNISEAKVTAALDKVRDSAEAERRTNLSDRLDTAVKAGKLTAGDKASVLKAYDAGVLGGPGRR